MKPGCNTDAGLLGAVYFATFLISNVVTNNAAAALLFPIAMDAAEHICKQEPVRPRTPHTTSTTFALIRVRAHVRRP